MKGFLHFLRAIEISNFSKWTKMKPYTPIPVKFEIHFLGLP